MENRFKSDSYTFPCTSERDLDLCSSSCFSLRRVMRLWQGREAMLRLWACLVAGEVRDSPLTLTSNIVDQSAITSRTPARLSFPFYVRIIKILDDITGSPHASHITRRRFLVPQLSSRSSRRETNGNRAENLLFRLIFPMIYRCVVSRASASCKLAEQTNAKSN